MKVTKRLPVVALLALSSCSDSDPTPVGDGTPDSGQRAADIEADAEPADVGAVDGQADLTEPEPVSIVLGNVGTGDLGGHTPRGFQGMGTGLFVGDNLNPGFPDGDGVQTFITFDLTTVPTGEVTSAVLRPTSSPRITGTPFQDLGALGLEEVQFDAFSSALWNLPARADGLTCVFAESAAGPFECDITAIVQRGIDELIERAQVRLLFDTAGDGDGSQDMVSFFLSDSNTNEPGIFELAIEVAPE